MDQWAYAVDRGREEEPPAADDQEQHSLRGGFHHICDMPHDCGHHVLMLCAVGALNVRLTFSVGSGVSSHTAIACGAYGSQKGVGMLFSNFLGAYDGLVAVQLEMA